MTGKTATTSKSTGVTNALNQETSDVPGVSDATAISQFISLITSGEFVLRAIKVIVGAALMLMGINKLTNGGLASAVGKAGTAAVLA